MGPSEPVRIAEYSPEWPQLYEDLAAQLRRILGPVALRIDHIGSTAIPGCAAKPVVDVQISVARLEPDDDFRGPLEAASYVWRRDNPDRTKRYFREAPGTRRTHLHVRRAGSFTEQMALLFRDYLRDNGDDRQVYGRTKRELAERYRHDRHAYTNAKGPVVWEILQRATRWAADTGWVPAAE